MSCVTDLTTAVQALEVDATTLPDEDIVTLVRELGELRRQVDARLACAAGALEGRCFTRMPDTPAVQRGYRTATDLVEAETGLDRTTAVALVRVGTAVTPRTSLIGEVLPAPHTQVGDALISGSLSVSAADRIVTTLDTLEKHTTPEQAAHLEEALVAVAPTLSTQQLRIACSRVKHLADPDGVEPTEEWLRSKATLTLTELESGLTRVSGYLHPEQAGFLRTALSACTAPRRTPTFTDHDENDTDDDTVPAFDDAADRRTLGQKRADALTRISRGFLTLQTGTLAGTPVTVLVTMTLDQLHGANGAAHIAGIEHPITAATARRLAAGAELIPLVLGGDSEVLDQGHSARLATPAQRRTLAFRDQGCIWGCGTPPGWCEVAHLIAWIRGGRTDLDNLALMCPFHHHLYDTQGWTLERRHGTRWLIPPPHVDPARTPRRAGPLPQIA